MMIKDQINFMKPIIWYFYFIIAVVISHIIIRIGWAEKFFI
jgi:hypothetical protein